MRFIIAAIVVTVSLAFAEVDICVRDFYSRGHGSLPKHCEQDKEYSVGFCYTRCKEHYDGYGPICLQECEEGFKDLGALCVKDKTFIVKDTYSRGLGQLPSCEDKFVQTFHLCYDQCKSGYEGIGSVCWLQCNGTEEYPNMCNAFIFGKTQEDCDKFILLMKEAKIDSKECLSALATAIITHDIEGVKECVEQIKSVYSQFQNTTACRNSNYSFKDI